MAVGGGYGNYGGYGGYKYGGYYGGYSSKYYKDRRPWRNRSRKAIKLKYTSYFFVFLITALTVLAIMFNSLYVSFFNKAVISSRLCSEDICISVQGEAKGKFAAILKSTGIPVDAVSRALDTDYIRQDMHVFAANTDGIFDRFDIDERQSLLKEDIGNYLKKSGKEIDAETSKKIDLLATTLLEAYADCVNLSFWPTYLKLRWDVTRYSMYFDTALVAAIAFIIFRLYKKNKKYSHRFFRYLYEYSMSVCLTCFGLVLIFKKINPTVNPAFSQEVQAPILFEKLGRDYRLALLAFGVVSFVFAVVFFITSLKRRKALIYRYKHEHDHSGAKVHHQDIVDFIESGGYYEKEEPKDPNEFDVKDIESEQPEETEQTESVEDGQQDAENSAPDSSTESEN